MFFWGEWLAKVRMPGLVLASFFWLGMFPLHGVWALSGEGVTPQGPEESQSAVRGRVVLNGLWKFMPATGPAATAPDDDWGLLPVPGSWQRSGWQHGMAAVGDAPFTGKGPQWKDLGPQLGRGWYEREIDIPAGWAGRSIVLDFRRVSTEATVFIDGKKCGEVPWPYGEVDITPAVTPGRKARLRVLVVATPDPGESIVWMGTVPGQNFTVKSQLSRSGIIGEVFLLSRPRGARISDVFVRTSVRKKEVTLEVELAGVPAAGQAAFTARMIGPDGADEKTFETKAQVRAVKNQTVALTFPWEEPKWWDMATPHLYTLRLSAKGPGLDDEYPQRFGFREFWIEGRNFMLNGVPIRLRPMLPEEPSAMAEIDGVIEGMRSRGFNASQMWPTDHDKRGNGFQHREVFAERASEKGWLVMGSVVSMSPYLVDGKYQFIWNAERREAWRVRMEADLRRYRNEPSVILWGTTANFFNLASDQDPRHIGRRAFLGSDATDPKVAAGRAGLDLIRKADPTRPVFTHAGNRMGDVYTLNHYLNMLPLQEREEHLSLYAESGEMALISVEFGNLFHCDVSRGRNAFQGNIKSEPWMTEFAASYVGPGAYLTEPASYRSEIISRYQGGQAWDNWQNNPQVLNAPAFTEMNALVIRNTWRSWRTWGHAGGMIPWDMVHHLFALEKKPAVPAPEFTPGQRGALPGELRPSMLHYLQVEGGYTPNPSGEALFSANGPTLAYLAGPVDDFTDKRHAYRPGEKVVKSAIVINDERTASDYKLRWSVEIAGTALAEGVLEGSAAPGTTLRLPVSFDLGKEAVSGKVGGLIRLEGTVGRHAHADTFAFRVHGGMRSPAPVPGKVHVWDPEGRTTKVFRDVGIPFERISGGLPAAGDGLLVVGREALSKGHDLPGVGEEGVGSALQTWVREGGRLLVMAQEPDWFRDRLGLRVARVVNRRMFPAIPGHPVVAGLDGVDLRDWAGSGTLVEPFPKYDPTKYPVYGWRWGTRGSVTSAAIEKPHHGAWRPLLECDFDLAYSPLMELEHGRGRLTLCTLDVEDRADPVAAQMVVQLVAHALGSPLQPRVARTVFLGSDQERGLLRSIGLVHESASRLPEDGGLAVIGPSAGVDVAQMRAFLERGGRMFFLGTPESAGGNDETAAGVVLKTVAKFSGGRSVPEWPELAGVTLSDVRNRADHRAVLLARGPEGMEIGADGLLGRIKTGEGVAVFSQLVPEALDASKRQWLRFTRWRQIRATSQILANLGASFESDTRFFKPKLIKAGLDGEWSYVTGRSLPSAPSPDQRHAYSVPGPEAAATTVPSGARPVTMPSSIPEFEQTDGEVLLFKRLTLPAEWAGQVAVMELGILDDYDSVYVNGKWVGQTTDKDKNTWSLKRRYRIPPGTLRAGENLITLRLLDVYGGGGMNSTAAELSLRLLATDKSPPFYDTDYREDFELGDEPYRYYRW